MLQRTLEAFVRVSIRPPGAFESVSRGKRVGLQSVSKSGNSVVVKSCRGEVMGVHEDEEDEKRTRLSEVRDAWRVARCAFRLCVDRAEVRVR